MNRGKVHWRKNVPLKKRLISLVIMLISGTFLYLLVMDRPISVPAGGVHVVEIKEPGSYVTFFKGDLKDPFGWQKTNGWIRKTLKIKLEPLGAGPRTNRLLDFKDISQANLFSVAEFEVFEPGQYMLYVIWMDEAQRCQGHIFLEKDVVEKFFYKWAAGIVCAVAFLAILGFPIGPDS